MKTLNLDRAYLAIPPIALVAMLLSWNANPQTFVQVVLGLLLVATVYVAVHHAETVALK